MYVFLDCMRYVGRTVLQKGHGKSGENRTRGIEKLGNRERKWEFWKEIGNGKTFILLVIQTLNLESVVWRTKTLQSDIIYQKVLFKLIIY